MSKTIRKKHLSSSCPSDLDSTPDEDKPAADSREQQQQFISPVRSVIHQFAETKGRSYCDKCYSGTTVPHLEFEISSDGIQLHAKAVKTAAWPIMATLIFVSPCIHTKDHIRFYLPRSSSPAIIGFYYGTTKPCANDLLKCVFKEMKLAAKRRICTMFMQYYIGDGPSRQLAKGFPASSAYCGCER